MHALLRAYVGRFVACWCMQCLRSGQTRICAAMLCEFFCQSVMARDLCLQSS